MKKNDKNSLTEPSQMDIVALALFLSGGDQHVVDTEDVAIEAHKLAPGIFCWRKYPDQINLELVRVVLSNHKKVGNGALLTGTGKNGWMLSRAGLNWARRNSKKLRNTDLNRKREQSRAGSIDERRWRRERARIVSTAAWTKWLERKVAVTPREAAEVFRIDSYAVGSMRSAKITRILALLGEEREFDEFLTRMAELVQDERRN